MRRIGKASPAAAPIGHERIYAVVKRIPKGKVVSYGQVARMTGRCTARMVGYAMAALPAGSPVPWQRVINARGMISARSHSDGDVRQRALLEKEGVAFDAKGRVILKVFQWQPPASSVDPKLSFPRKREFM
jgi:methylated-DNA-protein-cysteine methyltransferase related protein